MKLDYIKKIVDAGHRVDEREFTEFRAIKVKCGAISTAEGSALVEIGKTKVLAGVKLNLGEPYPDTPNEGNLVVSAEFVPFASPEFEPGPPGPEAVELARVVDRGIRESKAIDLAKLVILPSELVWIVHIDLDILNHDGNLIDAGALASIAALKNAYIPGCDPQTKTIIREEKQAELPVHDLPIAVTTAKISGKLLLDPTADEESCMDCRLTITTNQDGNICAVQKGGKGYFTKEEIIKAAELSISKGAEIRKLLRKAF